MYKNLFFELKYFGKFGYDISVAHFQVVLNKKILL